ncbi:MAG: hypothetical protein AMXMBFR64_06600 [Myxococcales bacterium]
MFDDSLQVQPPAPPRVNAAGLWHRAAAFALDTALVGLIALALCSSLGLIDWQSWPDVRWNPFDQIVDIVNSQLGSLRALAGATALVAVVYGTASEAVMGGTPGKRLLGLRVIDAYGRRPWLVVLVLRNVVKLVTTVILGLGPLWCFVHSERRAVHDLASGTRVVTERSLRAAVTASRPGLLV